MATDPMLTAYLARSDRPCPQCDYNLRDQPGDRCPECGVELALRLAIAEPRQAALITGVVGLSAGAGFSALMLGFVFIVREVLNRNARIDAEFVAITGSGATVEGTALFAWLWVWPRVRRMAPAARWSFAAACWLLTLANIVVFSLNVR